MDTTTKAPPTTEDKENICLNLSFNDPSICVINELTLVGKIITAKIVSFQRLDLNTSVIFLYKEML